MTCLECSMEFTKRPGTRQAYCTNRCRYLRTTRVRWERIKASPERHAARNALKRADLKKQYARGNRALLKRYGLTPETYQEMLLAQGGTCAICKEVGSKDPRSNYLHVDHCHKTGKVRGLLCMSCNNGLGRFRDSFDSLLNAAKYVQNAHGVV